jgi:hypothetical protein
MSNRELIMLWKGKVGVGECGLGGEYLVIYDEMKEALNLGWWYLHLGILSTLFGKLGAKQVGPTEGRQPRVCVNHRSYHLHMPAHLHIIYK